MLTGNESAQDIRGTVDKYAQPLCGTFPFPRLLNLYTFRAIRGFLNHVTTSERRFGCWARPASFFLLLLLLDR